MTLKGFSRDQYQVKISQVKCRFHLKEECIHYEDESLIAL